MKVYQQPAVGRAAPFHRWIKTAPCLLADVNTIFGGQRPNEEHHNVSERGEVVFVEALLPARLVDHHNHLHDAHQPLGFVTGVLDTAMLENKLMELVFATLPLHTHLQNTRIKAWEST